MEVLQIDQEARLITKRSKAEDPGLISFSDDDLADVSIPHSDALVITLRIANYDIKRVLIDIGSSANILFMQPYLKMGPKPSSLEPMRDPLIAFNGSQAIPAGRINLPMQVGEETVMTECIVMHFPSPYNAIMGRTWLGEMKAIPSTYH
ncbi:hypothetical protein QJS04_geneDACA018709 [Acorus gramineus]|uniref:Uncharacterized protein n=1 Tax=Acorus gramineus TaxID=55184 RepID=A0AAV9A3S6_ACOGR|nr:hypothetical protein QJS04_geneDACA018709 [Acorus gramineus]